MNEDEVTDDYVRAAVGFHYRHFRRRAIQGANDVPPQIITWEGGAA